MTDKNILNRASLKKIRDSIVQEQKKREYCILDAEDAQKLETLINFAILNNFGVDLFDNDD